MSDNRRDLEIRIRRRDRDGDPSRVDIEGIADSQGEGQFRSPFSDAQIQDAIAALDLGRLDTNAARDFGTALFAALIRDDVKTVYDVSSSGDGAVLGIRLVIDDPAVARIPWELMADPDTGMLLATRGRFVRGFSTTIRAQPISTEPPLRVLVAESSPADVPRLETQLEVEDIRAAVEPVTAGGRIVVETLQNATEANLQNLLRERAQANPPTPIHVLHWIGHGGIDPLTGTSVLLFEQDGHRRDLVDGRRLATLLSGYGLRLVFLNACYSVAPTADAARTESSFAITAGVAEALLEIGIPAVIGMQATVRDERARQVARDFYQSLADGAEVDSAILDARRLVRQGFDGNAADVGIPVCYLRAGSTRLLEPVPAVGRAPAKPGPFERLSQMLDRVGIAGKGLKQAVSGVFVGVVFLAFLAFVVLIQGPPRLGGEFNVVVTEFLATDSAGRTVESATAKDLSNNVFEALQRELVGQEGLPNVRMLGPDQAGRVGGTTPEQRAGAAAQLADKTNANLVIYGSLDPTGTSMQPEFYISPTFLQGAEEVVGSFRLGSPIRSAAQAGSPAVGIELRRNLQARTAAVTDFVAGLTWLATQDYPQSEARFTLAIENTGWEDRDGKEVVYLFRGTAAALGGNLDAARTAYEQSLAVNPDYGRAMFGLGEIQLLQSSQHCEPGKADAAGLVAARDRYRTALVARDQPPLSNVPAKAHFGIARVDVCLSQALIEGSWADAEQELSLVIAAYDGSKDGIRDLAAEAHALRAVVKLPGASNPNAQAAYVDAEVEYRAAIELSTHPNRKAIFNDGLGWVLERLGRPAEAAGAYDAAISLAPDEAARTIYREHRARVQAGASPSAAAPASST